MSDPILLTPGPLTTSARVKAAMQRDWGSRDPEFEALTARIRQGVLDIAGAGDDYTMVPLQGSGTFAVEAMLASLVPADAGLLVLENGAYGQRIAAIATRLGLRHRVVSAPDDRPFEPGTVAAELAASPDLAFVALVQCETTSGLLNPTQDIADLCKEYGRDLLIDAMSAFGALPCDAEGLGFAALAASSNKCLQGVPGLGFVLCHKEIMSPKGHSCSSIVLDLAAQDRQFSADGQWRFTPPTHVVAALAESLDELADEGGPPARLARYARNCADLIDGMADLGFVPVLAPEHQAPIIVSFHEPQADWFDFTRFYDELKSWGYAIYAGKMRTARTFRVGVIGAIGTPEISGFLAAAREVTGVMLKAH